MLPDLDHREIELVDQLPLLGEAGYCSPSWASVLILPTQELGGVPLC
jgi:hypothetical protein